MMCDSLTSGCKQTRKGLGIRWKWKGVRVAKIKFDRFKQVKHAYLASIEKPMTFILGSTYFGPEILTENFGSTEKINE